MSLYKVLEDWSEYDRRKTSIPDANQFDCSRDWEVEFLTARIKAVFPFVNDLAITMAIRQQCNTDKAVYPRKLFIESVLKHLGVI